jgi:hypothetical protein
VTGAIKGGELINILVGVILLLQLLRVAIINEGDEECVWDIGGKPRKKETTRKTKMQVCG